MPPTLSHPATPPADWSVGVRRARDGRWPGALAVPFILGLSLLAWSGVIAAGRAVLALVS